MSGRTLVRYTIPLEESQQRSHRLGVNALAVDPSGSGTLYSGGRDGVIAAWNLNMSLSQVPSKYDDEETEVQIDDVGSTDFKRSIQAHTNWVNDMGISPDRQSIYSCSSDTSVKIWRPNAFDADRAQTLGSHTDYIKCLTVPKFSNEWIATAGLDRSIIIWDVNGHGQKLCINDKSEHGTMKQSIYSIANGPNLLITGGIEKVMRIWETRSGARITKLVGHTDNVRSILCSEDGRRVISASSDSTIKVWDLVAGRCLQTLSVHSDPVWTLLSDHPNLTVFHAGDKAGLVSKTDLRTTDGGDGECVAVFREQSGINDLAAIGNRLFAATARSSINRWQDVDEYDGNPFQDPEQENGRSRTDSMAKRRLTSITNSVRRPSSIQNHAKPIKLHSSTLPANGLRRSSMWSAQSVVSLALDDDSQRNSSFDNLEAVRANPEATIRGQAGLISHIMLPDRTRVLTSDARGHVRLWDIVLCKQLKDYGEAKLETVEATLQSSNAVGSWCSVNTRVGALTVEMDPKTMFDAETYFDMLPEYAHADSETRNLRFNIGKWMLKTLFQDLIDSEIKIDKNEFIRLRSRPGRLDLSSVNNKSDELLTSPTFGSKNPYAAAMSPGVSVGLATPMPVYSPKTPTAHQTHQSFAMNSTTSTSVSSTGDYFSNAHGNKDADTTPTTSNDGMSIGSMPRTPGGSLMKNMKWLRSPKNTKVVPEIKSTTPTATAVSATIDLQPKNFREFIDQQRQIFTTKQSLATTDSISTKPTSTWYKSLEAMPNLKLPENLELALAHFEPGEGEAKDIYRGSIHSIRQELDVVKKIAPVWLAQILLMNDIPQAMLNAEANKHYFSFLPHPSSSLADPFNTSKTNLMRLGAARSLRIRKALTYISQRLTPEVVEKEGRKLPEEAWLEIVVNNTVVDPSWTLLMTRRHLWKQGGDMKLEYRLMRER